MPRFLKTAVLKFPLELEAHNAHQNVHRFYRLWTQRDLFQTLLVCAQYGRVGTQGRIREYEVSSEDEANKLIGKILKKREGALRRIGTDYKVV